MSETVEMFRMMKSAGKAIRRVHGVPCPRCAEVVPRSSPSLLLPQQVCKVDKYRDPRPRLTVEQRNATYAAEGIEIEEEEFRNEGKGE